MIDEIIKQLKPLINGKLVYLSQYGSHLYGLNTENSDLDFRGVYIPTLDDIILKKDKDEINTELEIDIPQPSPVRKMDNGLEVTLSVYVTKKIKVDIKIFSLQKFIQLCSKADTNALDLLFSIDTPADHTWQYKGLVKNVPEEMKYPLRYIHENRNKLINTDRMQSPCEYAHKQAVKYGLKVERYKAIKAVLNTVYKFKEYIANNNTFKSYQIKDIIPQFEGVIGKYVIPIDNKHVKIVQLDNKGKIEDYLFVAGVNHMLNLDLPQFIQRLESKLKQEYFSERTKDAINNKDEVDWKAMSHALRISYEIKELMQTGNITFPLKDAKYLLAIKQGKIYKEQVAEEISKNLDEIMEDVNSDKLGWKYDEEFWNEFILKEIKQ